jgi:quercetin dioxygenase-like cupin family protein
VTERTPGSRDGTDALARLEAEGLDTGSWSNGPGDRYGAHDHGYDKVLVVASGSIVFGLPARGERIALDVGDRLDLPAGTSHDAVVGPIGVTCLEAHIAAGTLPARPAKRPAGSW